MQANKNNNVQQKLENLSLEPSGKVWEEIEQSLKKRKRRYLIGWWWPLMLLPAALLFYWGWQQNNQGTIPAVNKQQTSTGTLQSPVKPLTTQLFKNDPSVKNNRAVPAEKDNNALQAKVNTVKISRRKKDKEPVVADSDEKITGNKKIIFSEKSLTKVKITNGSLEETMPFAEEDLPDRELKEGIWVNAGDSLAITAINDSLPPITNSTTANKKAATLPVVKRSGDRKTDKNKWETRMITHAGRAVFSRSGNEDPASAYFSPNTGTSGSTISTYQQYRPGSGLSMGIGIEKEKKLSEKISFSAGLSYNFSNIEIEGTVYTYSVTIQNGMPVYSNVTSISGNSRLAMHSLDASLLMHYRLSKNKFPLRLSAGIYNRLLFAGNWNHYKNALGKNPGYIPLLHLNPSVSYKKLTAGPYLQLGLTKIAGENRLLSYGLGIKYDFP